MKSSLCCWCDSTATTTLGPQQDPACHDHAKVWGSPTVHSLKTWPEFYQAVLDGRKKHEVRTTFDREFKVGDILLLREWEPNAGVFTGREFSVRVTYITDASHPVLDGAGSSNICVMSVEAQ